ncbi:hypothetical protein ACT8ZR_18380 [Neobacillus sp. M.A.Huq-85]
MATRTEQYQMVYKSNIVNALVRVKNKPNITLVAKAIIKLQENLEIQKLLEKEK